MLTAHHIVCDGWSINVIITELAELYAALRGQRQPDLDAGPTVQRICTRPSRRDPAER